MRDIKIVGLGGSLAEHSASLAALEIPLKGAEAAGLISTTGGVYGLQAVNTMEFVVRACGAGACRWSSRFPARGRTTRARK
jgi:hypothetical protein